MVIQSGKLRLYITIEQPVRAKNSFGEWTDSSWETFTTCWAAQKSAVGNLTYQAQQLDSRVTCIFQTRFIKGLKPTMRINYQGRYFEILSFTSPEEKREELLINCREKLD